MPFVRVQTEALGQCVIQTPPLRCAEEWALESGKEQNRRTQTRWGGQGSEVGVFQTDAREIDDLQAEAEAWVPVSCIVAIGRSTRCKNICAFKAVDRSAARHFYVGVNADHTPVGVAGLETLAKRGASQGQQQAEQEENGRKSAHIERLRHQRQRCATIDAS